MARPSYTICGGQADADRLARQAAVMAEATSALLARAGLRPGWACLDVGCGDGQVTVQLARAVGPGGRAVGLLSHLVEPVAALRAMRAAVQPAGVVAVEDLFAGTLGSDPRHRRWSGCRRSTAPPCASMGDPTIGPRLPALLATVGPSDVGEQLVANPMTTVDQKLFLAELVDNMRQAMLEARARDPVEPANSYRRSVCLQVVANGRVRDTDQDQ